MKSCKRLPLNLLDWFDIEELLLVIFGLPPLPSETLDEAFYYLNGIFGLGVEDEP